MRKLIIIAALLASTPAFAGDTTEKATLLPPQLRKQWLVAQSSKVMLSMVR
jgi:hypothetical protein